MDLLDVLHDEGRSADDVFSTQPIGEWREDIWLPRAPLERDFAYIIGAGSQHICIDGPSGTGKTSLTQSMFYRYAKPYIAVQVYDRMTWSQFCRNFVEAPRATKIADTSAINGVFKFFAPPSLDFTFNYTREWSAKDSAEVVNAMADVWTPDDVGRCMAINDFTLIVDDFERASDDLVGNIATLVKLMGQSYKGRVVIVGTDDVLMKVINKNSSISARVSEITVDGLGSPSDSANFIMRKFKLLGVKTPYLKGASALELQTLIYSSTSGLLKDLNELGLALARSISSKRILSLAAVRNICQNMIKEKAYKMRQQCRALARVVNSSIESQTVIEYLAKRGASKATFVAEIQDALAEKLDEDKIEEILAVLEHEKIIAVTGIDRRKIFFRNPMMFNGVVSQMGQNKSLQHSLSLLGGRINRASN